MATSRHRRSPGRLAAAAVVTRCPLPITTIPTTATPRLVTSVVVSLVTVVVTGRLTVAVVAMVVVVAVVIVLVCAGPVVHVGMNPLLLLLLLLLMMMMVVRVHATADFVLRQFAGGSVGGRSLFAAVKCRQIDRLFLCDVTAVLVIQAGFVARALEFVMAAAVVMAATAVTAPTPAATMIPVVFTPLVFVFPAAYAIVVNTVAGGGGMQ